MTGVLNVRGKSLEGRWPYFRVLNFAKRSFHLVRMLALNGERTTCNVPPTGILTRLPLASVKVIFTFEDR